MVERVLKLPTPSLGGGLFHTPSHKVRYIRCCVLRMHSLDSAHSHSPAKRYLYLLSRPRVWRSCAVGRAHIGVGHWLACTCDMALPAPRARWSVGCLVRCDRCSRDAYCMVTSFHYLVTQLLVAQRSRERDPLAPRYSCIRLSMPLSF